MSLILVDTNIVSYLYKQDSRSKLYEPRLLGQELGIALMTVAATALQYGLPLVTHDPDDFQQIPGLQVITEKK